MIRTETVLMHIGIGLIILGGVVFLVVGFSHDSNLGLIGGMVGWGCGAGTAVYSAAGSAIKKLKRRIVELETQAS